MSVVIIEKLSVFDVAKAREEYQHYIKITTDLRQRIVAIGGEYHADAEEVLSRQFGSKRSDIWGGGFNLKTHQFETNALINIRNPNNPSMEIIDSRARLSFLSLVQERLSNLEDLL